MDPETILYGPEHGTFTGVDSTSLLVPQAPAQDDAVFGRLDVDTHPPAPRIEGDMPLNLGRTVQSL